jgi:hypothetical protein
MNKIPYLGAALLPLALALAACSGGAPSGDNTTPKHPSWLYVVDDVSSSARVQGDDAFGKSVRARAVEAVTQLKLGDRVQLVEVGSLQADRLVAHPLIKTGYKVSLAKAARDLTGQMEEVARQARASGGDGSTNIIATLTNLHPDCASGRTVIKIVSDGVESSTAYDAGMALSAGRPVALPPAATPYLRGCRVEFIGFGVVSDGSASGGQLLPARELEALRKGWSDYLTAAGASEVTFTSLI